MKLYNLCGPGKPAPLSALQNPDIHGISLRGFWSMVEPVKGQRDFSFYINEAIRARSYGKKVSVRLTHGGIRCPEWFFAENPPSYITTDNNPYRVPGTRVTIPVWWSPQYVNYAESLIHDFGVALAPYADVVFPPVINTYNAEWQFGPFTESDDVAEVIALGYTTPIIIDAAINITNRYLDAFPGIDVIVAIGPTDKHLSPDTHAPVREFWSRILQNDMANASLMACDLADCAPTPKWKVLAECDGRCAFQMLWNSYNDDTFRNSKGIPDDPRTILRRSLANSLDYNPKFVEVYQQDVVNYQDVIGWAASL